MIGTLGHENLLERKKRKNGFPFFLTDQDIVFLGILKIWTSYAESTNYHYLQSLQ
jgi:hypothetical protein